MAAKKPHLLKHPIKRSKHWGAYRRESAPVVNRLKRVSDKIELHNRNIDTIDRSPDGATYTLDSIPKGKMLEREQGWLAEYMKKKGELEKELARIKRRYDYKA